MKSYVKKAISSVLAVATAFGAMGMLTACGAKTHEMQMKLEYEGETYTLTYQLYDDIAPATVAHFVKLVEEGYYNDICIHDYRSGSKMYTGAYKYSETQVADGGLSYQPYYDIVSQYKNFPHTVWSDETQAAGTETYTLYGEFAANNFNVKSGALKQSFGSLSMYYTEKDYEDELKVWAKRSDNKGTSPREYRYNSATSMFAISLSTTETSSTSYCTFAKLDDGSKAVLEDLLGEIAEVEEFTTNVSLRMNEDDKFVDATNTNYNVPVSPIVIKSMKITKYSKN